ncbi:Non-canonical purine NTP pyrophosphatase, partial [bacterium]|nr:Non-canonical purine NTP pyrophosphatase [bacterium]
MQIVVFTNNQNKIKEIEHVFKIKEIEIFPYLRVFKEKIDVVEDGFTFEENVRKKIAVF